MQLNNPEKKILIIDDNEAIHEDFKLIVAGEDDSPSDFQRTKAAIFGDTSNSPASLPFALDSAFQGLEGVKMVEKAQMQGNPYAMTFVDGRMPPGLDGIETIQRIWQVAPKMQVVFCTAFSDYTWDQIVEKLGRTDRLFILKKPFDSIEVRQIICSLNEKWMLLNNLDRIVAKRTEEIEETRDITVFALAKLAESRDPETGEHLERIRAYSQIIAKQLKSNSRYSDQIDEQFMENLYRSSPLHDIGKVGIPDEVLLKPDSLTPEEFEIMKQHCRIGADFLEETIRVRNSGSFLKMAAEIARFHHERFDGSGYPQGLCDPEIPLSAKIVALADVYDALTSIRIYKPAFSHEIADAMIMEEKGRHFDPEIIDAYNQTKYEFSYVKNSTNELAVSAR